MTLLTFAPIPLAITPHVARPKISETRMYIPPTGGTKGHMAVREDPPTRKQTELQAII